MTNQELFFDRRVFKFNDEYFQFIDDGNGSKGYIIKQDREGYWLFFADIQDQQKDPLTVFMDLFGTSVSAVLKFEDLIFTGI